MENQLSDILDNVLGLLLLEGSYDIEEKDDSFFVSIETSDAGRLIGARGESLDALQQLVNQMILKKLGKSPSGEVEGFKRVIIDVEGWRKQKEDELAQSAKRWGEQVLETKKEIELEPMSSWQRRIVHMVISETEGVESESLGEGRDRHIVIKLITQDTPKKASKEKTNAKTEED